MSKTAQGPRLKAGGAAYYIHWTEDGRSRRRSTGQSDRARAEQVFGQWLQSYRQRTAPPSADPRVDDVLDRYLTGHVRTSTADPQRVEIACRWLAEGLGDKRVSGLNDAALHGYIADRRAGRIGKRAAGDGTIRRELAALKSALRYAVRQRLLLESALPHVPMPTAPAPREAWLDEAQVETLLGVLASEDADRPLSRAHRFTVLALATGARKGAIESLRWDQVDLDAGLIRFDRQVTRQTNKRRVAVPIADWLVPYLERMEGEATSAWVLDHDGPIRGAFEAMTKRVAKTTGDPVYEGLTRHALRHTFATLALRAGATLWQVAGMLGDNVLTVSRTYGHHGHNHTREAANSWRK